MFTASTALPLCCTDNPIIVMLLDRILFCIIENFIIKIIVNEEKEIGFEDLRRNNFFSPAEPSKAFLIAMLVCTAKTTKAVCYC